MDDFIPVMIVARYPNPDPSHRHHSALPGILCVVEPETTDKEIMDACTVKFGIGWRHVIRPNDVNAGLYKDDMNRVFVIQ